MRAGHRGRRRRRRPVDEPLTRHETGGTPLPHGAEHGDRIGEIARRRRRGRSPFRRWVFENGLVLAATALFLFSWGGQAVAGLATYNSEREEHGQPAVGAVTYLRSSDFWNATAENWQSEFLQLAMFVVLTARLRQKGSPESKPIDARDPVDADPRLAPQTRDVPWPVRRGGLVLRLYEHSLSIALALLFLFSFGLHFVSSARSHAEEQGWHGELPATLGEFSREPQFWFEVFQNWQSEFLAVAVLALLTIWLRERGSAQSKPVAAPHDVNE